MEQIPWYQSGIIRQQIVMLIVAALGLFKVTTDIDIDATVAAVFAGIAALVPIWTIITRLTKAHPPLTATAAAKETAKQQELKASRQGGFARISLLVAIVFVGALAAMSLGGCTHTQAAYKAAEGVDQRAYVALEHYSALQKEAIVIKGKPGTPPEVVDAIKKADAAVYPVAKEVKSLRDSYLALKTAPNEAALQAALNDLVLKLVTLVDAVKAGRTQ